mgnify:CR=1 FL=1
MRVREALAVAVAGDEVPGPLLEDAAWRASIGESAQLHIRRTSSMDAVVPKEIEAMRWAMSRALKGEVAGDPLADEWVHRAIAELESDFVSEEHRCVLETVGANGEFLDHLDGRQVAVAHGDAPVVVGHEDGGLHLHLPGADFLQGSLALVQLAHDVGDLGPE